MGQVEFGGKVEVFGNRYERVAQDEQGVVDVEDARVCQQFPFLRHGQASSCRRTPWRQKVALLKIDNTSYQF